MALFRTNQTSCTHYTRAIDPYSVPDVPLYARARAVVATARARAPYYVPIVTWLPQYKWRSKLIPDILAGVAVSTLLIPQSLACKCTRRPLQRHLAHV